MFRRATSVRTWPKGEHEWSGTIEHQCWLEVAPDAWIGTNRLCESEQEAKEIQEYAGYGDKERKTLQITATLGWIKQTADPDSVKVLDPA